MTPRFKHPWKVYLGFVLCWIFLPLVLFAFTNQTYSIRNFQIAMSVILLGWVWFKRKGNVFWEGKVSPREFLIVLGSIFLCYLASLLSKYYGFEVSAYNFSIFGLMLYNTANAQWGDNPICECNHFAVHLNTILFLMVPIYKVINSHLFLLLLQGIAIWAAAFPLYRIAKRHLNSERIALLVVVSFLLYAKTTSVLLYPFHPEVFYIPFGFWLIELWETSKKKFGIALWFLPALGIFLVKEEAGIYTFGFALGQLIFGEKSFRLRSLLLMVLSLATLGFMNFVVLNEIRSNVDNPLDYMVHWGEYGDDMGKALAFMLTHPHVVVWNFLASKWYVILGTMLFLPLLSGKGILGALPGLMLLGISSKPSMINYSLYHSATFLPYLFYALIDSVRIGSKLKFFGREKFRLVFLTAVLVAPLFGSGYLTYYKMNLPAVNGIKMAIEDLRKAKIKPCVQGALIPHLPYDFEFKLLKRTCDERSPKLILPGAKSYPLTDDELLTLQKDARTKSEYDGGIIVLK